MNICIYTNNMCVRPICKSFIPGNIRRKYSLIKGSLEVKLSTIWTDEKAEVGRVREEKRRKKIRESEKRKSQVRRQKMQTREKVAESRNIVFFQ